MAPADPTSQTSAKILNDMIQGYRKSQAIYVTAELGIADILKDGPKTSTEVAAEVGVDQGLLQRFFLGLVLYGIVVQRNEELFELIEVGHHLRADISGSMRKQALGLRINYPAWGGLLEALKTNKAAFDHAFGMGLFDYIKKDSEYGAHFNENMVNRTHKVARSLVSAYDFSDAHRVVDIGGGFGALVSEILKANPDLSGTLFDMPSSVKRAERHLDSEGVLRRCEVIAGNMFEVVPGNGDVYVMKNILHDWQDVECQVILKNCYGAMKQTGKLLVVERLMPDRVGQDPGTVNEDLLMMVFTGGCERTVVEYQNLLASCNFELQRVLQIDAKMSILECAPV